MPSNALVIDAKFEIYREGRFKEYYYDLNGTYYIHAMTMSWDVDTWELGKGFSLGWDKVKYDPKYLDKAEYIQYQSSNSGWYSLDVTDAFVKYSVADISNNGFIFRSINVNPFWNSGGRVKFASSDISQIEYRPKLIITYELDSTININKKEFTNNIIDNLSSLKIRFISNQIIAIQPLSSGDYTYQIFSVSGALLEESSFVTSSTLVKNIKLTNQYITGNYVFTIRRTSEHNLKIRKSILFMR